MTGALVEVWQCDEKGAYTTIPLTNTCAVELSRREQTASILFTDNHSRTLQCWFRLSAQPTYTCEFQRRPPGFITQIYFKGDPHLKEDSSSASPQAVNRILEIKDSGKDKFVTFDIVMSKQFPLEAAAYKKLTGLYSMDNNKMYDFL
jgi:protocatechuate 3,4-dioxygenase beta subunit